MVSAHRFSGLVPARLARLWSLLAILALGACASVPPAGPSAAQRNVLTANGFVETARGWELALADRLLFASDESKLQPDQLEKIAGLGKALRDVEITSARVEGHTDKTGSSAHNKQLSRARALTVASALRQGGMVLAAEHIQGRGEEFPVGDNRTAEGRADNRRVVILVMP